MSAMPERWTDREIDGLSHKVDGLRAHVDKCFQQVDKCFQRVDERFEQVDKRFERIEAELLDLRKEMNAGFEFIRRTMFGAAVAIIVALISAPHL